MMFFYERTKKNPIANLTPHYTNDRFKKPQTVFLLRGQKTEKLNGYDNVKGATYNYSDRMLQWYGWEKYEAAHESAKAAGLEPRSASYIEHYLRQITDDPKLKLVHIMAGFNVSNGSPYQVYGYIPGEKKEAGAK